MHIRGIIIGHAHTDWEIFAKICKETFHKSPLKSVDEKGIGTNSPMSFCYSMESFTGNLEDSYKHILIVFMFQCLEIDSAKLFLDGVNVSIIDDSNRVITAVASGTLTTFYRHVTDNIIDPQLKTLIYDELCSKGFRAVFKKYTKELNSGIVTLKLS